MIQFRDVSPQVKQGLWRGGGGKSAEITSMYVEWELKTLKNINKVLI